MDLRVSELQDADCGDHAGETREARDSCSNYECNGPVYWYHDEPSNLTACNWVSGALKIKQQIDTCLLSSKEERETFPQLLEYQ